MPRHTPEIDIATIQTLQNIWLHLAHQEFALFPNQPTLDAFDAEGTTYQRWFTSFAPYTAYQHLDQITDAVSIIQMHHELLPSSVLEWNYLGNQQSQHAYYSYIHEQFWKHQNEVMEVPGTGAHTLDAIWEVAGELAQIVPSMLPPTEFMDDATQSRLQRLTELFASWEYNPYLIVSQLGSLHWRITSKSLIITGHVHRENDKLSQSIQYTCLTNDTLSDTVGA